MRLKEILNKKSSKFALITIGALILIILIGYLIIFLNLKNQTQSLTNSSNLVKDIESWSDLITSYKIFPDSKNQAYRQNKVLNSVDSYINNVANYNKFALIKLPIMSLQDYKETENVLSAQHNDTDNNYFAGRYYNGNFGEMEFSRNVSFQLKIGDKVTENYDIEISRTKTPEYIGKVKGTLEYNATVNLIKTTFANFTNAIKTQDILKISEFINDTNTENISKQILAINNIDSKLNSLKVNVFESDYSELSEYVSVGSLVLNQDKNLFSTKITVVYNKTKQIYQFLNPFDSFASIPNPNYSSSTSQTINCSDCFLAAVDKNNSLPSNFAPSLVNISISGGGQLTKDANTALNNLNSAAKAKNIDITVISSYRSYQTQITTFNYWVGEQKKKA